MVLKSKVKNLGGRPALPDSVKRLRNTLQPCRSERARARRRGEPAPPVPAKDLPPTPAWWTSQMREDFAESAARMAADELNPVPLAERLETEMKWAHVLRGDEREHWILAQLLAGKKPTPAWDETNSVLEMYRGWIEAERAGKEETYYTRLVREVRESMRKRRR